MITSGNTRKIIKCEFYENYTSVNKKRQIFLVRYVELVHRDDPLPTWSNRLRCDGLEFSGKGVEFNCRHFLCVEIFEVERGAFDSFETKSNRQFLKLHPEDSTSLESACSEDNGMMGWIHSGNREGLERIF